MTCTLDTVLLLAALIREEDSFPESTREDARSSGLGGSVKYKLEQLYQQYHRLIYVAAYRILNNEEDAEDAELEVWEKLIRNLDKIAEVGAPETKSFIMVITERTAINLYRKNQRRGNIENVCEEYESSPYFFTSDRRLEEAEMYSVLRSLPKREAEVLTLYYVNGCSQREIGQLLGIKESAVGQRLHRAKKHLQEIWDW